MNILKYILVASFLPLQTSLCFAQDSINFSVGPDLTTHCNQFRADVAISTVITLGVMPAIDCANRQDRPDPDSGSMVMNSQVTNKFNRILIPMRYSPYGALRNGFFVEVLVGAESSEYNSVAGSTANVTFIDTAAWLGYQWFWHNGLNFSAVIGRAHLIRNSLDKSISNSESSTVSDYLDQQTSTNTHTASGMFFGWAF